MTTTDVIDVVLAVVREELRGFRTAELGVVTRTHPHAAEGDTGNGECDVRLRDSGLELHRVPVATQRVGAVALPEPDDLVLVQFLAGDVHAAVITARLHDDVDRAPVARQRELVYECPDPAESGVRRAAVVLPGGNRLTVDDDALVLEMGRTRLTVAHDGDVTAESGSADITLTDDGGGNSLTIAVSEGVVTVSGTTKVVVDAPRVELVSASTHPLVLGDELLTYLNQLVTVFQSHVHPGQTALGAFPVTPAPPVPPAPTPTPALLSTTVTTG